MRSTAPFVFFLAWSAFSAVASAQSGDFEGDLGYDEESGADAPQSETAPAEPSSDPTPAEGVAEVDPDEEARRQARSPTTIRRPATPLRLRAESGHQSLEVGMYLSAVVQAHLVERPADGSDGFVIGNARLAFWGDLLQGFEYLLQLELARPTQPLLDVAIGWEPFGALRFDIGLFKVPFSAEFLLPAANTTLINRSQVVATLAPNRQAGLQVSGELADGAFTYAAGMFNGNTFDDPDALTNVDNDFLYALRLGSGLDLAENIRLDVGANVAGGREDDLRYGFVSPDPFAGGRLLLGFDASVTLGDFVLSTEIIGGLIDVNAGVMLPDLEPEWVWGFHATAGYAILDFLAVYARWDSFDTTAFGAAERSDWLILSVASGTRGAAPVSAQLDFVIPVRDTDGTRLLFNVYAVF